MFCGSNFGVMKLEMGNFLRLELVLFELEMISDQIFNK
jgi:hypothetical protein